MKRTITISELKNSGINSWSVKDSSVRGIATKHTNEIQVGDKVVIANYFTEVVDDNSDQDKMEMWRNEK